MRENKEPVNIDHLFIAIFCSLSIWCSFAMYTKQSIIFFIPPLILQIVSTVVFSAIERRCRKTCWRNLFLPYGICTLPFLAVFWEMVYGES